ncbi:MAG: GTPase HflX [Armatimonadetes bacterium]|nr:GTPase HflX [Armatimonadota bacterium]
MNDLDTSRDTIETREFERAVLVGIEELEGRGRRSMRELIELTKTAGALVVGLLTQSRRKPDQATFIGKGKVEELRLQVIEQGADLVIFDGELSPIQNRNLVAALEECKVLDRTELILDIFAQHAHSHEGKLQVELAQLRYTLPRLAGRGKMLDRIRGGTRGGAIGVRGPGEAKIDVERRTIRRRISRLEDELAEVRGRRDVERRARARAAMPAVALVGYTNAGKSTLFNALVGSHEVSTRSRLFETLDPTTRRVELGEGRLCLLSDTVGFIQDLPHHLIAAFRATLEEVTSADLLLHVVDAADTFALEQYRAAADVVAELGAEHIPTITVLNKTDMLAGRRALERLERNIPNTIPVSALEGDGLDDLRRRICDLLFVHLIRATLHIPYDRMDLLQSLHEAGMIVDTKYEDQHVVARAELDEASLARVRRYVVSG